MKLLDYGTRPKLQMMGLAGSLFLASGCSGAKTIDASSTTAVSASASSQDAALSMPAQHHVLKFRTEQLAHGVTLTSSPNPAAYGSDGSYPVITLKWTVPSSSKIEIHMQKPDGILFTQGQATGIATTGAWVQPQSVFYVQDLSQGPPGKTVAVLKAALCADCKS